MSTFMYFAYGSNLSSERIHHNNPSAIRKGYGELNNYRLDFITYSKRWQGASATIVPTPGKSVWGAIWELNIKDMKSLDEQEGVPDNWYFPLDVDIETNKGKIKCRTYQQIETPETLKEGEELPMERRPSSAYCGYIISGAEETGLPKKYIEELKAIPYVQFKGEINLSLHYKA